jgi:hypothetical protein
MSKYTKMSYAKLPYVTNDRNHDKIDYKAYYEMYNTMYYVNSGPYRTYFYSKNNIINYYRKWLHGQEMFVLDLKSAAYKPIRFRKLSVLVEDEKSILIKTKKGKWYIVTREAELPHHVLIMDALNGICLYKERTRGNGNIYIEILYPIANRILPIIHVSRLGFYVRLFDMEDEKVHTIIAFSLENIDQLVKLIVDSAENSETLKHNLLHCKVDHIEDIDSYGFRYSYGLSDEKAIYMRGVRFEFSLHLKYKNNRGSNCYSTYELRHILLCMELGEEGLNCSLDLSEVQLHLTDEDYNTYTLNRGKLEPIIQKYPLSNIASDIYLSRYLYKDQCYYIYI